MIIMVSSFYSVQYIVKFLPLPFFPSSASTSTLRHLLSLPIDKYCVFAHDIRNLIHTNKK